MIHTTTALKRHLLAPAVLMLSMPLSGSVLAQVAQDSSTKDPVEMELNLTGVSHRTIHIRPLLNCRVENTCLSRAKAASAKSARLPGC